MLKSQAKKAAGVLMAVVALPVAGPFAQDAATSTTAPAVEQEPGGVHSAIRWAQTELAEMDAAISALEQDSERLTGNARAKADEALQQLRTTRDSFKTAVDDAAASTTATIQQLNQELETRWTEFETGVEAYLVDVEADAATRKEVFDARLAAQQEAFRLRIEELNEAAKNATGELRSQLEQQAANLSTRLQQEEDRLNRLGQATNAAWDELVQGLQSAREAFEITYGQN